MTLAAVIRVGCFPTLLSDFLVTGLSDTPSHIKVPGVVRPEDSLPPEFKIEINALYRKTVRLGERTILKCVVHVKPGLIPVEFEAKRRYPDSPSARY